MSKEIDNGQYRAWAVFEVTKPWTTHLQPAVREWAGTVWTEEEALRLNRIVNKETPDVSPSVEGKVREIGVVVLNGEVIYDLMLPGVPLEMVSDTADAARSLSLGIRAATEFAKAEAA